MITCMRPHTLNSPPRRRVSRPTIYRYLVRRNLAIRTLRLGSRPHECPRFRERSRMHIDGHTTRNHARLDVVSSVAPLDGWPAVACPPASTSFPIWCSQPHAKTETSQFELAKKQKTRSSNSCGISSPASVEASLPCRPPWCQARTTMPQTPACARAPCHTTTRHP